MDTIHGGLKGAPKFPQFFLYEYLLKQYEKNTFTEYIIEVKVAKIWKNQNLIDINTPSFINLTLEINKRKER